MIYHKVYPDFHIVWCMKRAYECGNYPFLAYLLTKTYNGGKEEVLEQEDTFLRLHGWKIDLLIPSWKEMFTKKTENWQVGMEGFHSMEHS